MPDEATRRLGDHFQGGSWDDVRRSLKDLAHEVRIAGYALLTRPELGAGCRVYPAIAQATADQLSLLAELVQHPLEITAGVCRLVFEINVVLRYCLSSQARLEAFNDQAEADEVSILKAIKTLAHDQSQPAILQAIDRQMKEIRERQERNDRNLLPEWRTLKQMVKEVGLQQDYDALYGLYSKYVHASAWFVVRPRADTDIFEYRAIMQVNVQHYAGDTLVRLRELGGVIS